MSSSSRRFVSLWLLLLVIISNCRLYAKEKPKWGVDFYEYYLILEMGEQKELRLDLINLNKTELINTSAEIRVVSDSFELWVDKKISVSDIENDDWHGTIVMDALFIGAAHIFVEIERKINDKFVVERSTRFVSVQIIRQRPPTWMYTEYYDIYELVLYLITRLMLGVVLKWGEVKRILDKPLCVGISLCCSILIMPMVSNSAKNTKNSKKENK